MYLIDKLAEEKITEAIGRGELDNLPGAGKPLHLDDDSLVPEVMLQVLHDAVRVGVFYPFDLIGGGGSAVILFLCDLHAGDQQECRRDTDDGTEAGLQWIHHHGILYPLDERQGTLPDP